MIDASRESVSRVLNEFDKEGIIKRKGKRIEVENRNTLLLISSNG
jgi:CRP-like cAMP-binding protein